MQKWRENRDKLVGQLELVLKEKDAKIAEIQATSAPTVIKQDPALHDDITRLRQEVADKNETIAELSRFLEGGNNNRNTRGTRGGRPRLGSDTSHEQLRKEVENLYRQLENERIAHREETNRAVRAKDSIISDLKQNNIQLQSTVKTHNETPHSNTAHPSTCPSTHTATVKVELQTPSSTLDSVNDLTMSGRKRGTRNSGRKRKTSESELQGDSASSEVTPCRKRISNSTRGRAKSSTPSSCNATMQCSFSENNPEFMPIQEEDMVDLSMHVLPTSANKPNVRHVLSDTLNTPSTTLPGTDHIPTFVSPQKEPPHSTKKKRLRSTVTEPFQKSPIPEEDAKPLVPDAHKTVKRQLRSRKKATQV